MNKFLFLLGIVLLQFNTLSAQDQQQQLEVVIAGDFTRTVKHSTVQKAMGLGDLVESYPYNWVKDYEYVQLVSTENGQLVTSKGANNIFTAEQRAMLKRLQIGVDITVVAPYRTANTVTGKKETREMTFTLTIVPEKQAKFTAGDDALKTYISKNITEKVGGKYAEIAGEAKFVINESGKVESLQMTKSTGDASKDAIILSAIQKMPTWIPAKDSSGKAVKQKHKFMIGKGGC